MRQIEKYPLWLGNAGDVRDPRAVLAADIAAVVDLALSEAPVVLPREIVHCRFPLVDGGGNPPWLLRAAVETVANLLRAGATTLIVCGAGMSRTPAIAAVALALVTGCSLAEALAHVTRTGPVDVSGALWADIGAAIK